MADRQAMELLFFDTFSHENAEELNLDLVQFPRPVLISEVRVIPLQTRVQADVPGGVRLGATNPSSFQLELFVNNLSKPNASTFEKLGILHYKANEDIQMLAEAQIPTDGLILKGLYNTVTVAIFGALTSVTVEPETLPPPPPPQPRKQAVVTTSAGAQPAVREVKTEPKEWEPPTQVVATPHTTQHPLDYIEERLQQANLQVAPMTVTAGHPPHSAMVMVPGLASAPPQMALGVVGQAPLQEFPRQEDYGRHPADTDRFSPGRTGDPLGDPYDRDRERDHYEDSRSRDSWSYRDDRRSSRERHGDARDGRDYPTSREGSRDRERGYRERGDRGEYRDRDDWDLRGRDRGDYDRSSKEQYEDRDRGRFDDRDHRDGRDREFEGERDRERDRNYDRERDVNRDVNRDANRDTNRDLDSRDRERENRDRDDRDLRDNSRDNMRDNRDHGRDYDRGRDMRDRERDQGYREREADVGREQERDRNMDRSRPDWDQSREPDRGREIEVVGRDIREGDKGNRGFRDRTREDYRERAKETVYMETEAPRSPSRSRSRSFSGDRFSSKSRSPTPAKQGSRSITPNRSRRESPSHEVYHVKDSIPEQPLSPSPDHDLDEIEAGSLENLSPEQGGSLIEQVYMSDGDYEAISSEDELIDIDTDMVLDYEMDEEAFSYITAPFNPYQFEVHPLVTFDDVSLTLFEVEKSRLLQPEFVKPDKRPKEAQQLLDYVERFNTEQHFEQWIEAMESVPSLLAKGLSYLVYTEAHPGVVPALLDWMVEGLDEQKAMAQPESTYKVRHLKMGFKLAGALTSCDANITVQCLGRGVQGKLLDVFSSQFMSFSLKLQIVAALDQTIRLQDGLQWFMGTHRLQTDVKPEPNKPSALTHYQRAVGLMLKKQVVRVTVAMTTLLRKVHLFEVMSGLGQQLDRSVEKLASSPSPPSPKTGGQTAPAVDVTVTEADLDSVTQTMEEILKVYTLAPTLITQPPRTLPGRKMVEAKTSSDDPYPYFYHLANSCNLLESILLMVSSPTLCCTPVPVLFGSVRSLIQRMMSYQHGLVYLTSRSEVTNKIIQALIQVSDYNRDEVSEENLAQQLGIELIYSLETVLLVDKLNQYINITGPALLEDQQVISVLHMLYTITFTPIGQAAAVQVFTYDNNINALLPFVTLSGKDKEDARLRKSVCAGYATELLNIILHYTDNIDFLQKHGTRLLAIGEQEFSSKLSKLKEWLSPLRSISVFTHEGLAAILEQVKTFTDDVRKLPRGLITILRILKHLSIAPPNDYPEDKNEEMKYKYVLVEMFSAECLPLFVNFLQRLGELMLRPWQQGIPKSSEAISLYLYIIKPCIEMVKAMTQYLIMARGTEFHDLTTLPTLFELHTVLCSVPAASLFTTEITAIQREIIDTIAAYTQPLSQHNDEKDKISQSLWTLTIRDLLKFTMKAPYTYLSGLQMLSELLPLPLPLQTREPLSKSEEQLVLTTRKLWSAHLLPLHTALHNMIRTLAVTSCHPLQQILRKICWQMSDLAAPTATMITQCILDILLEHLEQVEKRSAPDTEEYKVALATRGRFLNLLMYLISQPAIKCTMLRIMGPGGGEKYAGVLEMMLGILNHLTDREDHVQDQESIVSILQSLCDIEVTLTSGETSLSLPEQVANALPTSEQLTLIIEALLEHIAHPNHKYDSVLPCIRALVMLTEHDYSFYLMKTTFVKHKLAVYRLLSRIKFKFSKDSSDCLSTFSTTLEFLRLLVDVDMPDTRRLTLTNQELRDVVAWTQDVINHPLVEIQKLLEESLKEEETLDTLVDSVNSLLAVLRRDSPVKDKPGESSAASLPEPQSLLALFNMRSVCTVTEPDDDRLSATFWQTTFEADEPDMVVTDLEGLCMKYCKDFNLEEELKKDTALSEDELTKPKKLKDRRKSQEFVSWRGRGIRRPFVAPMRGRGIARGLAAQATRHDAFRNRPSNTSRPPSMHVDDFMKLEQKSEQGRDVGGDDQGRRENEFVHARGRGGYDNRVRGGFDRGRGRFFTPPGSFRRDPVLITVTPQGRTDDNPVYRSKPPFVSPRFGGNHDRSMSGDHRDNRPGRFEHRGRGSWRGNWAGPSRFKDDRFGGGGMGFRGRSDPNRHQRSFTK